jgi:Sec-independent protein secretion pathway component TatC
MNKTLIILFALLLTLHGLIHLLGFVAYWPLKDVPELAYKTVFLNGRLDFGAGGTRLYSVLWLVASLGFIVAAVALFRGQAWGMPVLVVIAVLSGVITALDWNDAFRGTLIDAAILAVLLFGPQITRLTAHFG